MNFRSAIQNALLVGAALLVFLALAEIALRLIPGKYRLWFDYYAGDRTTLVYQGIGGGLRVLKPGQTATKHGPCFETAPVTTNADGFRDRPWRHQKSGFRLLALGDSFIEAAQVGDGAHVSAELSRTLGLEVMNAGISGYSTVTQIEAYRRLLRGYQTDLVVLFFYLGNDVKGNACDLDPGRALCGRVVGGEVTYRRPGPDAAPPASPREDAAGAAASGISGLKAFLRRNFASYLVLYDLKTLAMGAVNGLLGYVPSRWRLYMPGELPAWRDAWRVTEDALTRLAAAVERDGGRLALVAIPEHFVTSRGWETELMLGAGFAPPEAFDPGRPQRRLEAIARRLGVPYLDLAPALLAYRDGAALDPPYFSFACDGHWNPLTHALAASEVAAFLARRGLLPAALDAAALEAGRAAFVARAPNEILGQKAFAEIYGGGRYVGGAPAN